MRLFGLGCWKVRLYGEGFRTGTCGVKVCHDSKCRHHTRGFQSSKCGKKLLALLFHVSLAHPGTRRGVEVASPCAIRVLVLEKMAGSNSRVGFSKAVLYSSTLILVL